MCVVLFRGSREVGGQLLLVGRKGEQGGGWVGFGGASGSSCFGGSGLMENVVQVKVAQAEAGGGAVGMGQRPAGWT